MSRRRQYSGLTRADWNGKCRAGRESPLQDPRDPRFSTIYTQVQNFGRKSRGHRKGGDSE